MNSSLTPTLAIATFVAFASQGCLNTSASGDNGAKSLRATPTMNTQTKRWTSSDQSEFPFRFWTPPDAPAKAVLIGVHGLNGSSEDFDLFGNSLIDDGIAVYAYEMRGQGNDPMKERIGDIKHPRAWLSDLATFSALVRSAHPDAKIFIYGESLGSLITTFGVQNEQLMTTEIAGVILASPLVSFDEKLPFLKRLALQLAAVFAPSYRIDFAGLSPEDPREMMVTSSASVAESGEMTPWLVEKFSLRFFSSVGRMIEQMMQRATRFEIPVLVLSGGNDVVTRPEQIATFTEQLPEKIRSTRVYPEGHHLLLYDEVNTKVLKDCRKWIIDQLER